MPDGRTYNHARAAAVLMTTLTTVGLGLATASPAAADTNDIDAVQARVDRLSERAAVAEKRHDRAATSLTGARTELDRLTKGIDRQRRIIDSLRTQVASAAVDQGGAAGASVPTEPVAALSEDAKVMLINVVSVSEDTGRRGEAIVSSSAHLQRLSERRAALRDQLIAKRGLEKNLRAQQSRADSRAASAGAILANLQQKAEAARQKVEAARQKAAAERLSQQVSQQGGSVIAYAKSQVGKAYVFGAAGPDSFDCSGLTMMAWSQSGVSLPHNSTAQYNSGPHISESELQPGDLVFYYSPISHVGIYIGNGQIVNALNPGSGVQISGLHDMPYVGAVRPG